MDLDGDGRTDILSGSWPGEIYFFRRKPDGTFAAAVKLHARRRQGDQRRPRLGRLRRRLGRRRQARPDRRHVARRGGLVLPGIKGKGTPRFGESRPVLAAGKPIKVAGDAAPVVADWDGDGKPDLLVGAEDGSVVWYRNVGTKRSPRFAVGAAARRREQGRRPRRRAGAAGQALRRRLGLAMASPTCCWATCPATSRASPPCSTTRRRRRPAPRSLLPGLRKKWAARFADYEKARDAEDDEGKRRADLLREEVKRLKDEIARLQEIQVRFRPQHQKHGFVWLFRRNPTR